MALRRGAGLVLGLILGAVVLSFGVLALLVATAGRGPLVGSNSTLFLHVGGDLAETEPGGLVGQFLEAEARTWGFITQPRTVTRPTRRRRLPSIPGAHRVSRTSDGSRIREVERAWIKKRGFFFSPCGRRWREAPDEGVFGRTLLLAKTCRRKKSIHALPCGHPSSDLASLGHLLPQWARLRRYAEPQQSWVTGGSVWPHRLPGSA